MTEPGALFLGGAHGTLAAVRSLGRRGVPAWVLAGRNAIARYSRYTRRTLTWPDAGDAELSDYLMGLGTRHGLNAWTLFAGGDEEAAFLSRNQAGLSGLFRVPISSWPQFQRLYHKGQTYQLAASLGLDYPWTECPESMDHLSRLPCPFPAIVKPAVKPRRNPLTQAKAWPVRNRGELESRYAEACTHLAPEDILIQELVPGGGESQFSYAALCAGGQAVAELVARRSRQYPVDFGYTSSFVETLAGQGEVEAAARRFLAALEFTGLVEVEFKCDARDGRYKLLDVNGRLWQWISLGERAGVDFPYLAWKQAQGRPLKSVRARPGAAWLHCSRDLPAATVGLARRNLRLADYVGSLRRPLEFAVLAADDPVPALVDPALALRALLGRRGGASAKARAAAWH